MIIYRLHDNLSIKRYFVDPPLVLNHYSFQSSHHHSRSKSHQHHQHHGHHPWDINDVEDLRLVEQNKKLVRTLENLAGVSSASLGSGSPTSTAPDKNAVTSSFAANTTVATVAKLGTGSSSSHHFAEYVVKNIVVVKDHLNIKVIDISDKNKTLAEWNVLTEYDRKEKWEQACKIARFMAK